MSNVLAFNQQSESTGQKLCIHLLFLKKTLSYTHNIFCLPTDGLDFHLITPYFSMFDVGIV